MKINFIIRTKRTAMPKGLSLEIEGRAEVPTGMSKAELVRELKRHGSEQFVDRKGYHIPPSEINVILK